MGNGVKDFLGGDVGIKIPTYKNVGGQFNGRDKPPLWIPVPQPSAAGI
jgi:hypothetical protein